MGTESSTSPTPETLALDGSSPSSNPSVLSNSSVSPTLPETVVPDGLSPSFSPSILSAPSAARNISSSGTDAPTNPPTVSPSDAP